MKGSTYLRPGAGMPISPAGWTLIWTLSLGQLISWGSLYYSFAVYALPMEQELGWSRTELNGALSLGLLVNGLFALPVGAWIDRHGGRGIMLAGSVAGGVLLLAWSETSSLLTFYVLWAALGAVLTTVLYEPAFAVLTANLGPQYRRAITMMTLVGGLASTVFIPLTQWLIDELGWRQSLVILGAFNLIVCAGIHLVFLKGTKPGMATIDAAADPGLAPMRSPFSRALKTGRFWGLAITLSCYGLAFSAITFHLIPLLTERGMSTGEIVWLMALIGPMQVVGRLLLLAAGPRLTARQIGRVAVAMQPIAMLLLILAPATTAWVALFAVFYGMSNGMMTIVRGTIVPEVLGHEGYATINGALAFPTTVLKAVAPLAAAMLWSLGGGYVVVLWSILAIYGLSALSLWLATRRLAVVP